MPCCCCCYCGSSSQCQGSLKEQISRPRAKRGAPRDRGRADLRPPREGGGPSASLLEELTVELVMGARVNDTERISGILEGVPPPRASRGCCLPSILVSPPAPVTDLIDFRCSFPFFGTQLHWHTIN